MGRRVWCKYLQSLSTRMPLWAGEEAVRASMMGQRGASWSYSSRAWWGGGGTYTGGAYTSAAWVQLVASLALALALAQLREAIFVFFAQIRVFSNSA